MILRSLAIGAVSILLLAGSGWAEDEQPPIPEEGRIITLWPLFDYRESPADDYWNLAVLGPIFKFQQSKSNTDVALRPFVYSRHNAANDSTDNEYLYPLASSQSTPEVTRYQFLKLLSKDVYRKDEPAEKDQTSMFFPFYISGTSKKYGPYTSVFPLYGDIYDHFWRDEYHYALFPLYGRTVKNGVTNHNYLYPFFGRTTGEHASGFRFWPLYGQSAKEGDFRQRFVLWPFYTSEETGLGTANPTSKVAYFPLYDRTESPKLESWHVLWPFFGYLNNRDKKYEEWYYGWPLFWSAAGEGRQTVSVLPLYKSDRVKDSWKYWVLWPLFRHEEMQSELYRQERDRVLFFLYSDERETWLKDNASRRRTALWPLFSYKRDPQGMNTFSFPAPIESIFYRDEIERSWAPLWRLYIQRWNESGDSAVSFLWNLYWHESRGDRLAYELFPLISYQGAETRSDFRFLKGLVRYRKGDGRKNLSFFWLPVGFSWEEKVPESRGGTQ